MPYKSLKQERWFHYAEKQGKIPHATVQEFDQASKGKSLPQTANSGMHGGMNAQQLSFKPKGNSPWMKM